MAQTDKENHGVQTRRSPHASHVRQSFAKAWPLGLSIAILAATSMLLSGGCSAPKAHFQTQKLASYPGKLEKVVIAFMEQDTAHLVERDFLDQFAKTLAISLAQREIPSATVRIPKTELDREKPLLAATKQFYPTHLIFVGSTNSDGHGTSHETAVTLQIEIKERSSRSIVWRADATFPSPPSAKNAAQQFLEQLVKEKLL